jgi:hypothetical protein
MTSTQPRPRPVFSLWLGGELSPLAEASIASFLRLGHEYTLYSYERVPNTPEGTITADARTILGRRRVRWLIETKAYALVSDLFRYAALRRSGGLWVDTDLIALRAFDFADGEIVLGFESDGLVNNAVFGAPAHHWLVEELYHHALAPRLRIPWLEDPLPARAVVHRGLGLLRRGRLFRVADAPWGAIGPRLLTWVVRERDLGSSVREPSLFYPIGWREVDLLLAEDDAGAGRIGAETYAVHLWGDMLARRGVVAPPPGSLLQRLCAGTMGRVGEEEPCLTSSP